MIGSWPSSPPWRRRPPGSSGCWRRYGASWAIWIATFILAKLSAIFDRIAAAGVAAVGREVGAAITDDIVAEAESAAAGTPKIEPIEADFEATAGKAIADEVDPNLFRLSASERQTLERAQAEHPELGLRASAEERDGEYTDNQGRPTTKWETLKRRSTGTTVWHRHFASRSTTT